MRPDFQQLLKRIGNPRRATGLSDAAKACFETAMEFQNAAKEVHADPRLTQAGKVDKLKDLAVTKFLPAMNLAQVPIAKAADALQQQRRALSLPAPDPTDVVAAMERQEIRAMIRGMDSSKRVGFVLGTKDDRILSAILSAPAEMSGISAEHFAAISKATIERKFGEEIAEINEAEEAIAAANAAFQVASGAIQGEIGVTDRQFAGMQKRGRDTPWLIRDGDTVRRVIPGATSYPAATATEIATGKFYDNEKAWREDNPGATVVPLNSAA
ncbi:MAG: hypothetical protein Devi2KO_04180 [Devosia indica]